MSQTQREEGCHLTSKNRAKSIDSYWERYREIYSFESTLSVYRERKAVEFIQSLGSSSTRILEIGFGLRPIYKPLEAFGAYTGIEPGLEPFEIVLAEAANDERVQVKHGFFNQWAPELRNSEYDAIISIGVLQDIPDPKEFLQELATLMGPETLVYINVPNANSLHRIIGLHSGHLASMEDMSGRQTALEAKNLFTEDSLIKIITSSIDNVAIRNSGSFFVKPFTHAQMEEIMNREILGVDVMEGLYGSSGVLDGFGAELFVIFQIDNDE